MLSAMKMDSTRMVSNLPSIKCSNCAADIEISRMGEHVCSGAEDRATTPPADILQPIPRKQTATNAPNYLKPGRAAPPRVDTSAANGHYFPQEELTPVSASPFRSNSPFQSQGSRPFMKPLRSATAPIFRGPPSPELRSSNLDCAFPAFGATIKTPNRPQQVDRKQSAPNPMYAPISPRTATSGGLLKRMDTIAPGPFNIGGQKKVGGVSDKGHQRQGSKQEVTKSIPAGAEIQRPATAAGRSRTTTNSSNGSSGSKSEIPLPKTLRIGRIGGFGATASEDGTEQSVLISENRSQTFPMDKESQAPSGSRPSEVAETMRSLTPPNESARSRSPLSRRKPSVSGPDLSRPLPPRGASLIRPKTNLKLGESPPLPVNLAAEFGIGNPYHTPKDSSSSNTSAYSETSKVSSESSVQSSPSRSIGHSRQQSDTLHIDALMANIEFSIENIQPKEPVPKASPPRPSPPRTQEQYARPLQPPPRMGDMMLSPDSPTDPAIQAGRLSPIPRVQARSVSPAPSEPQYEPIQRPTTAGRQPSSRPSVSKGNCKDCGEVIKGKSVSSADGRLTGRYHKQCFSCKTCQEPFQTSTFYVINDAPYCERHYHKLNGSVCQTCDKGIEGQYIESERKQKFHPGCLTCADCKRTLRHDYFEMNGGVYCERDAFKRAQQAPRFLGPGLGPSNRMERRTTKLMNM